MIAVLHAGMLVEFDSPAALLAKESLFREMYRSTGNVRRADMSL